MNLSSGKIWPYAIGISITFIFIACIATIVISSKLPVEKSDINMMGYHEANAKANELIKAKIAFNKKYKIEYITDGINMDGCAIKYKVTDLNLNPVDNANIKVIITRPNNHKHDQELNNPRIKNGVYTFNTTTLSKMGRWDIMAKINVEDVQRFYNVKADTRSKEVYEY
jgi:hypothetical protein